MKPVMLECDLGAVKVETELVPQAAQDDLAAAILEGVREYFQQPGVMEKFAQWQERRKQKKGRL